MGNAYFRHEDQKQFDIFAKDYDRRFINNYPVAYGIFKEGLTRAIEYIVSPLRILDLACGNGWAAEFLAEYTHGIYLGIDPSEPSLKILLNRMKKQKGFIVKTLQHPAKCILEQNMRKTIRGTLNGSPNLVICNAAFHQITKTFSAIDIIIKQLADLLNKEGVALLGDYYYPDTLSKEMLDKSMQWIKETTGQNPTPPKNWFSPQLVSKWINDSGLKVLTFKEERANKFIYLNYYMFICQKDSYK